MRPFLALPAAGPLFTTLLLSIALLVLASESNGLHVEVTKAVECSRKTRVGDSIRVHYKGTLEDGTLFDTSYGRTKPFSFTLGEGQVIKGWDQGLLDMCVGEGRRLIIPPELAYGNRRVGIIPAGSTLVFDTELMGIKGVPAEPAPPSPPTPPAPPVSPIPPTLPSSSKDIAASASSTVTGSVPAETTGAAAVGSPGGPKDHAKEEDGECRLLGPFALLVQGALGALALLSLVWKRYRESPRRPVKIWWFDASKQVFGSVLLHLANLFMSMLSSGNLDVAAKAKEAATTFVQDDGRRRPNPCSFYLLNLAIDTTIGIPILVLLLRLLHHAFLLTPLAKPPESIKSGNYGHPPRVTWWLKQSIIYFLGLFGMKLCVFIIFQILPWIAWVGDWALRWTEGNEALQITFVMLIFPLIMNALQYYIIDSFIKDPAGGGEHQPVPTEDLDEDDEGMEGEMDSEAEEDELDERRKKAGTVSTKELVKEANPTPVPVGDAEYDPETDEAGSSSSSSPRRNEAKK